MKEKFPILDIEEGQVGSVEATRPEAAELCRSYNNGICNDSDKRIRKKCPLPRGRRCPLGGPFISVVAIESLPQPA